MKSVLFTFATAVALVASVNTAALASDTFHAEVGGSGLEHFQSTKTRAEVQAQARGQALGGEGNYPLVVEQKSQRPRAEVMQEFRDYVKSGHKARDDALLYGAP